MKNILIIPNHPLHSGTAIRLIEIARQLSVRYNVYLFNWHVAHYWKGRVLAAVRDLVSRLKIYKDDSLNIVEFPFLRRPLFAAPGFNSFWMKKIIEKEKIDTVVNGSYYLFSFPEKRNFKYIFDLADLPAIDYQSGFDRFIYKQTEKEVSKADMITVVSCGLADYVRQNYNRHAEIIPNGAYVAKLRAQNSEKIKELRFRYGLNNKWVIGYIGLIGSWVDVAFTVELFRQIKKEFKDAALLMAGPSPRLKELRRKFGGEDIIFTGLIKEEIKDYFNLIDIAILPHKKSHFQDLAFHIKALEYSAARKVVIASPLEELKRLNFPNIFLADLNISDWLGVIKKAKEMHWADEWDRLAEAYEWSLISGRFSVVIEEGVRS